MHYCAILSPWNRACTFQLSKSMLLKDAVASFVKFGGVLLQIKNGPNLEQK